ncbi:MAG: hypothetical protein ACRDBY_01050 [Cetobacterium sp.]
MKIENLNNLYTKDSMEFKQKFDKNHVFALEEIDSFHDNFMSKHNLNWNDIEDLIKLNQCEDSIELFIA